MHEMDFLKKVELFRDLSTPQLNAILTRAKRRRFARGESIIQESDPSQSLFILFDGRVEVSKQLLLPGAPTEPGETGALEKTLIVLEAKDRPFFGEIALLENVDRTASVKALEDCKLFELTRADFDALIQKDSVLGYTLFRIIATVLSRRLRKADTDILKLTTALMLALRRKK